ILQRASAVAGVYTVCLLRRLCHTHCKPRVVKHIHRKMKLRCHIDEAELLTRLCGAVGEPLDQGVISYLRERGALDRTVATWRERHDDAAVMDLEDEYVAAKRFADHRATGPQAAAEPPNDAKIRAANHLAAAEAGGFDYVRGFRHDVLQGRLL